MLVANDLVKRLRETWAYDDGAIRDEAADEIERLTTENSKLKQKLWSTEEALDAYMRDAQNLREQLSSVSTGLAHPMPYCKSCGADSPEECDCVSDRQKNE